MPIMLKRLIIFFLALEMGLCANIYPWNQQFPADSVVQGGFNVLKHEYTFSTEFELEWEGEQYGRAIKSSFNIRSQYDLYDVNGDFAGNAVGSWIPSFGLGWLYSWAADFTLYDRHGFQIGSIDGSIYTDAVAKFIFRDIDNNRIAVAYMDRERTTFTFHSPTNVTKKILEIQRQIVPYRTDYWKILIYEDHILPPEMIQFFAIFASDRQNDFKSNK